jgi:hypothetical protein
MRHEERFDEALDLFEALLRDYPDLAPADRALAEREIADLSLHVGSLAIEGAEAGARIVVDSRERGVFPLAAPLRLAVGSHVVRVSKVGFSPLERTIEIASGRATGIDAKLDPTPREATPASRVDTALPLITTPPPPVAEASTSYWTPQRVGALSSVGVGVIALGIGAGFMVAGKGDQDRANGEAQRDPAAATTDSTRAVQEGNVATAMAVGGGVAALAGGVLWLTVPKAHVRVSFAGPVLVVGGSI